MKKKLSVIISVICIIVSLGSISGTLYYAKNHNTSSMMQQAEGTPPSMPNQGENSQNNESNQQDSSQNNKSSNDQSNSQNQDSMIKQMKILMDKHLIINKVHQDKVIVNQLCQDKITKQQSTWSNESRNDSINQSLTALQIVIITISVLVLCLQYLI